jgi:hypothetical protein
LPNITKVSHALRGTVAVGLIGGIDLSASMVKQKWGAGPSTVHSDYVDEEQAHSPQGAGGTSRLCRPGTGDKDSDRRSYQIRAASAAGHEADILN